MCRETQESLNYALYPSSHHDSVAEILGFIRSINDDEVEAHIRRDNSVEDEDEEEYVLSDLEDYENQREYILANPSAKRTYNYSKKRTWDEEKKEESNVEEEEQQENDEHFAETEEIEKEERRMTSKERRRANRRMKYQK